MEGRKTAPVNIPEPVAKCRGRLYTQQEVADRLNVDVKTVRKVERDPLSVQGNTLRAYLALFGWRIAFRKGEGGGPYPFERSAEH